MKNTNQTTKNLRSVFLSSLLIGFAPGCTTTLSNTNEYKALVVNEYKADGFNTKITETKVRWGFDAKTQLKLTHSAKIQKPTITSKDKIAWAQRASGILQFYSSNLGASLENSLKSRNVIIKQGNDASATELVINIKSIDDFCTWISCSQTVIIQARLFEQKTAEAVWFSVYETSIPLLDDLGDDRITKLSEYIVSRLYVAHLL